MAADTIQESGNLEGKRNDILIVPSDTYHLLALRSEGANHISDLSSISDPVPNKDHSCSHPTRQLQYHKILFMLMLIDFEMTVLISTTTRSCYLLIKHTYS